MESNPFDTSEEGENDDQEQSPNQQAAWERIQKERDKERKRAEAAEARLAERDAKDRERDAGAVLTGLGLSPKHARFLLSDLKEGEVTEEAVRKWATENDLAPKAPEGEQRAPTFSPGPPGVPPPQGKIPWAEFQKMLANPATNAEAMDRFAKGQVETTRDYDFQR